MPRFAAEDFAAAAAEVLAANGIPVWLTDSATPSGRLHTASSGVSYDRIPCRMPGVLCTVPPSPGLRHRSS